MKAISLTLMLVAVVACGAQPAAEKQSAASPKWEYRVLKKDEVLELGQNNLATGLNKLGLLGWELTGIDGSYVFKRPVPGSGAGVDPKVLKDIQNRISFAEYDVEAMRDRVAWTERMVRKGLLAENALVAQKEQLRRAELALEQVRGELPRVILPPPNVKEKKDSKPKE